MSQKIQYENKDHISLESEYNTESTQFLKFKNICQKCGKRALYNYEGKIFGIFCKKDKQLNMVKVKKCQHGKQKARCKECGGSQICEHNKDKARCKECGGSSFCIHEKDKRSCKECGGNSFCIHDKNKSYCKECGGSQICEHNKNKSYCKECGGNSFCIHNKYKTNCKECGRNNFCEHGRKKTRCRDCGGNSFCIHDKRKNTCKECGGSQICIHNKYKASCKECGGSQICIHNKYKRCCKECGGSQICIHNIQKQRCKECDGNRICIHDKLKELCKICDGNRLCKEKNCEITSNYGYCGESSSRCSEHKLNYMITNTRKICIGNDEEECKELAIYGKIKPNHCEEHKLEDEICWLVNSCKKCGRAYELLDKDGLCFFVCSLVELDIKRKKYQKIKESNMIKFLRDNIILKDNIKELPCDTIVNTKCNLYRPDLPYDCGTHILIIECDENQHKNYNWELCPLNKSLEHSEEKRMYEIMQSYGGIPIIFLRWNPDNFIIKGVLCKSYSMKKRLNILKKWVEYCMFIDIEKIKILQYKKLFYDDYKESDITFKTIIEEELL
jgi:hypothetical protein